MLGWSQQDIASFAGVAKQTVQDFEIGKRTPYPRTLADIVRAFEAAGIIFTNGEEPGLRLGRPANVANGETDRDAPPLAKPPRPRKGEEAQIDLEDVIAARTERHVAGKGAIAA